MHRIAVNSLRLIREIGPKAAGARIWNVLRAPATRCLSTSGTRSTPVPLQTENAYASGLTQQLRRDYVSAAKPATNCWNCKKEAERKDHMICSSCGILQDVDKEINYFDLLDFPKNFEVEIQELTKRFRHLQTLVHPDKFSTKSSREQLNSAEWSSLINKAYKTLSVPIERGQYMLKLHGEQIPQDNSALNKEFLMEMMERNEAVQMAKDKDELARLHDEVTKELNDKVTVLKQHFQANAIDSVKEVLVQMKYLVSIQNSIKKRMQHMIENS